jgi:putative FmdB family regulatory protein
MPIYEFVCQRCGHKFENIESFDSSEKPRACPICDKGKAVKIPSVSRFRMERIFDNAERGPRAFFGEDYAGHENWMELAEESEMVQKKREELVDRGELNDFIYEEGKYETEPGDSGKTIDEV